MQEEKVHPIGLPEWVLDRVDATFAVDANYIGCVCLDERGSVALVEPEGHFRGVSATLPKVARASGERPSQTLVRCLEEKVGAGAWNVYPIVGVWEGDASRTAFYAVLRKDWGRGGPAPTSPHVAAVHDCSFEAALDRIAASRNRADRLRDLTILPIVRAMALTPARRLLLMVRALHRMGFERLRADCSFSPSGMHWRFDLFSERADRPATWTSSTLEGALRPKLDVAYSTALGQRFFGLEETCFETPEELASRIVREAPQVAFAGLGRDPDYARWLDDMLARTAPEGIFVDSLDGDLPVDRTYLANAFDVRGSVPLAPSTAHPLSPVKVSLRGREDGVWFGRLDDARLRGAKRWFAWVAAREGAPMSSDEIARCFRFGAWSTIAEAVTRAQSVPSTERPPYPLKRRSREGSWLELPCDHDWRAVIDERTVALYLPPPWTVDRVRIELWALCERVDPNAVDLDEGAAIDRRIDAVIADIDARLAAQTDAILHHPLFRRLEAIWRSLELVVREVNGHPNVRVEMWSCSLRDLREDLDDAGSVTRTTLYNRLWVLNYGDGPYGLVVGDYEFGPDPSDIALLDSIATVCSAAGTPFIASASPRMFGVARWGDLTPHDDLLAALSDQARACWRAFRARPESRFVGLCLQRVLLRAPHRKRSSWPTLGFDHDEAADDSSLGLWGSAAAALATRVARSFIELGWCANFVGADDGAVVNVPSFSSRRDGELRFWRPVEAVFSSALEQALGDAGFIVASHRLGQSGVTFLAARSCYDVSSHVITSEPKAVALGRALSAELPYLCLALRFAHCARAMQRERVGEWRDRDAVWRGVNAWLATMRADDDAPMLLRPLRDARLMLRPTSAGRDDQFDAALYVTPRWVVDGERVTLPVPVIFPTFW